MAAAYVHAIFNAIDADDRVAVSGMIRQDPGVLSAVIRRDEPPLFYALSMKLFEMALVILDCGGQHVDVNVEVLQPGFSPVMWTPLHVACHHVNLKCVKALVERGADPLHEAAPGYTPLRDAVNKGPGSTEVIAYMLRILAVRNHLHVLHEDMSYLGLVCAGPPETLARNIQLFLDAGADATYPDNGFSPMSQLEYENDDPAAKAVLQASIDESLRARHLFRAWFVTDARLGITAAMTQARKQGLGRSRRRRAKVVAAPKCLKDRVRDLWAPRGILRIEWTPLPRMVSTPPLPLPKVVFDRRMPHVDKQVIKLTLLLPRDLFKSLMQMMTPPGDFAWRNERLGKFLERVEGIEDFLQARKKSEHLNLTT